MRKAIYAIVTVLLVSSPAWAGIIQGENFASLLNNQVNLLQGEQTGTSSNFATILNNQCASLPCNTAAIQRQIGFFNQVGSACGQCSLIGVTQTIAGLGVQLQTIGDGVGPKAGAQSLALDALQLVTRQNGGGSGNANQTMSISQDQLGTNAAGPMSQGSVVFGTQATSLAGGPGSTGAAGSSLAVTTSQQQAVN